MSKQINQYTKTRTSGTFQNDDLLDFDSTEDSGTTYESAKSTILQFINYIKTQLVTFYTSDGSLTGNRTIDCSGNYTKFDGGNIHIDVNDEITDRYLIVNDISDTEVVKLGYDNNTDSALLLMENTTGNYFTVNDGELSFNDDVLYADGVGLNIGTNIGTATNRLNIKTEGSVNPISVYEDEGSAGVAGQNNSIEFFYNDSLNAKTLGGTITTRIDNAPTAGNVNMGMTMNNALKIQSTGRVLVTPSALTAAAVAQFEVRSTIASGGNTTALFKAGGNTASQLVLWLQNLSGNNLMYVDATAKHFHNVSKLTTGDFQMSGGVDTHAFYFNAGTDRTGFGTNNALERVHSVNKVRADEGFNFNGNDGITEVLTFGGGSTGDVASLTVEGGIITSRTLVP
jgi:hypothetical protein